MSLRRRFAAVPLLLALSPLAAAAHSVSDEVSAGDTEHTLRNPRTGYLADKLRGSVDLSDALELRLGVTLTHDNPTPPQHGARWGDTGGDIFSSLLGVDWTQNDHFTLGAELDYSPQNEQRNATTVSLVNAKGELAPADALVRSLSSSWGAVVSVSYDTAGESSVETAVDLSAAVAHFDTRQNLARVEQDGTAAGVQAVRDECAKATTQLAIANCRALRPALRGEAAALTQLTLQGSITETLFTDTDVTLGGAWFLYDQDPTQVGYFSTLVVGRTHATSSFGGGIPVAPLLYDVRPELLHRFGPFQANAWYQYSRYVDNEGYGHLVGLKLQYAFSKSFRLWASGTWQRDLQPYEVTAGGATRVQATVSRSGALGVKLSW